MKVLDVKNLNADISQTKDDIHNFQDQITAMQKAVRGVASLEDSLKGKTGDAIRSFYNEVHQPFLIYMYEFLIQFKQKLDQINKSIQSFEPDPNGFVREEFLQKEVNQGLQKTKNVTIELTDGANEAMNRVRDIVHLPQLDPQELIHYVDKGRNDTRNTIEQLHALDKSQTSALQSLEQELSTMKNYIADLEGKFQGGDLSIANYSLNAVQGISSHKSILSSVYSQGSAGIDQVGNAVPNKKTDSVVRTEDESIISVDPLAPFDSPADLYSRGAETVAFTKTYNNVRKGLAIDKYEIKNGEVRYKVSKPELIGLNKSKGRNNKIYSKPHVDAEVRRGNNLKVSQYVNPGSGATQALKSRASWLGVLWSTGSNIHENIKSDASTVKIVGDAGVDVGLGAVSLATGGLVMSGLVGFVGAPVLVGAAAAALASVGISSALDGVKIGEKSISEHIKNGVQSVAGWVKGIFD